MLALVLLALVISYASSLRAWLDQRQEIAAVEADIAQTRERVAELRQTKQRWHDDAYIKKMARERFGWVLPGEVGYRVINEDGETVGETPRLGDGPAEEPTSDPDWYDRLWGSLRAAGQEEPEEPKQPKRKRPDNSVIKPQGDKPQRDKPQRDSR